MKTRFKNIFCHSDRTPSVGSTGFSILEVVIAMLIVMIAISATMTGAGYSNHVQSEAERNAIAAELAGYVQNRLYTMSWTDPLLADVLPGVQRYTCWGINGTCVADHGTAGELAQIFEPWTVAGARAIFVQKDANGIDEVWYEGYTFHIAWNIFEGDMPPNMKEIEVMVTSPPYNESVASSSGPYNRSVRVVAVRKLADL